MRTAIARLGLTALVAAGGLALTAPTHAATAESGSCDGVAVLVEHDGSTDAGCAAGDPKTAGEALQAAGFDIKKVQSDAKLLCSIDGVPDTSCAKAPEADAFWGFFIADGNSWGFADKGVFAFDPKPGSTIAFSFGSGDEPTTKPKKASAEAASAAESASSGEETSASDASDAEDEGSSTALVTTVGGVVVLAILAGAGILVARRRRS